MNGDPKNADQYSRRDHSQPRNPSPRGNDVTSGESEAHLHRERRSENHPEDGVERVEPRREEIPRPGRGVGATRGRRESGESPRVLARAGGLGQDEEAQEPAAPRPTAKRHVAKT